MISSDGTSLHAITVSDNCKNSNFDKDDIDAKNLLLLALADFAPNQGNSAGCYYRDYQHEDDGLLSGLFVRDDGYDGHEISDGHNRESFAKDPGNDLASSVRSDSLSQNAISNSKGGAGKRHLMPSFFDTKTSLSSVSPPPWIAEGLTSFTEETSIGRTNSSHRSNVPRRVSNDRTSSLSASTKTPSFHGSNTTLSSFSPSGAATSFSIPNTRCAGTTSKGAILLESTSLLQGSEMEMVTIIESVLDSIVAPDDGFGCDSINIHIADSATATVGMENVHRNQENNLCDLDVAQFPCPTPQEVIAMDRNRRWDFGDSGSAAAGATGI